MTETNGDSIGQTKYEKKEEGWIGVNVAPLLALVTVLCTFFLFWIFIQEVKSPTIDKLEQQKVEARYQKQFNEVVQQLQTIDSMKPEERQLLIEELQSLKEGLDKVRTNFDDSKEQRGVVKDIILYILGVLSSIITSIYSYYFGSSRSSAKKDEAISDMKNQNK